jgi:phosphoglycerate kinase
MSKMDIPRITDLHDLRGKRIIVRSSLNVPIEEGKVVSAYRITEALPTLKMLSKAGARIVLLTHIGRDQNNTVEPVFTVLKQELDIHYVPQLLGPLVEEAVGNLKEGEILLLENVRSDRREQENDPEFAAALAAYGEIFVNDAFADSHRASASIVGIPNYLPSFAGLTFAREYEELTKALVPAEPSLFILAGAKFETKQKLIEKFSNTYDRAFIGGALANDLLKARGYGVGVSLVSDVDLSDDPITKKDNIIAPIDVVVHGEHGRRVTGVAEIDDNEKVLDVGPASVAMLEKYIEEARTILWNGTLGNYENGYVDATEACARHIAKSGAYSVVGGGDTIAAIESLGLNDRFGFVSTAGGAMLVFLEEGTLPGIEAIRQSARR